MAKECIDLTRTQGLAKYQFSYELITYAPFEMCAVASFVRRGARSYVWRVIKLPVDI